MMFVDGIHETNADFYHGDSRIADKNGFYEPLYTGVDILMLYTLTPGVTTSFKNIKFCEKYCEPGDRDLMLKSASRLGRVEIITGLIINILIMTFCMDNRF